MPQTVLETGHPAELAAVGKSASCVYGLAFFNGSPATDRIEILQRKADRVHQVMAARTGGIDTVLGQSLTDRKRSRRRVVLQRWHVWQRWRRRRSKDVFENPLAANHRRGPRGIRGHRENAALAQQPAPVALLVQCDAPKAAAVHVGNPVMLRQPFIQERVVRLQEVEHTAVVAEDRLKKKFR